jgi:putative transcriptional regulator
MKKKTTRKAAVARAGIGGQIIEGLKEAVAFEQGDRAGSRVYRVKLTARAVCAPAAPVYGAQQVKQIRTKLGLSQAVFGMALNVSTETIRAWEQGKNQPGGPAERLLEIAEKHPGFIYSVVRSRDDGGKSGT